MKRLYLTVEGQTEQAFAKRVLVLHLAQFHVMLHSPRLTGLHRRRRGRIPRGGLLNTFAHTQSDIRTWLLEDRSPDARFSMMVDLYSLPTDFPGYATGMAQPAGRPQAIALERALSAEIAYARFLPYLQVHEYEALVLVDPLRIATLYEAAMPALRALSDECSRYASPEEINHGQHSHPKHRIQQVAPNYDENVAGPLLVEEIGLAAIRTQCPHFNAWLTRLENLDLTSSSNET